MTRVLLTGANGYVGRPVHDSLLARGYEVHAVSRHGSDNSKSSSWHSIDLLDETATDSLIAEVAPTHLVHLAWVTEPGSYWQSSDNQRWQESSTQMLRSFVAHGGQRAVLAGTCAEYDWTDGHCIENETPLRGLSEYTKSKLVFRQNAYSIADETSLQVSWARIFFSFGPHEHPSRLIPDVVLSLLDGGRASCSDGEQLRDFMYVKDMASAFVAVLASDHSGDINIASGDSMTIKNLVTKFGERLGATNRVDFGTRPRQAGEAPVITADIAQLRDIVGWHSEQTIDTAIDATIDWWQQQGKHT